MIQNRWRSIISAFSGLVKLKLTLAVTLSSVTGFFLCNGTADLHLLYLAAGVFLLASGSSVLNQYTERRTDALMTRTMNRPIPSGVVTATEAMALSVVFITAGIIFLILNGPVPVLLGALTVVLYNFIYTRLKKITFLAIIPGGIVGAIPPLIGYTSAGGNWMEFKILAFCAFMFLWQLPHFWIIIIRHGRDYSTAGFPSLSRYLNEMQIRNLIFIWVLFSTIYLSAYFLFAQPVSRYILILLAVLNINFIILFYRILYRQDTRQEAKNAFILINSFSLIVMILLITLSALRGL
jgi:heme o synthase